MGAIFKAVATSMETSETSYLKSGSEAVRQCLDEALSDSESLDILINTGIYPDDHIHEPAFAALIQGFLSKSFAAKLTGTFSFDVHNGGGGSLMALSILNGFIESGKIQHGMVLAGDSRPMLAKSGAALIGRGAESEGFQVFSQDTYPQFSDDYKSYSNYTGKELETFINQDNKYTEHCLYCVRKSVQRFLSEQAIGLAEIDLFIPSQSPVGFVSGLADLYGNKMVVELKGQRPIYSAGILLALAQASSGGNFRSSEKVLFINVGPGIMVDLALYINPV